MSSPEPHSQDAQTLSAALTEVARCTAQLLSGNPSAPTPDAPAPPAASPVGSRIDVPVPVLQAAANIATHAWRAQRKMLDSASGETRDDMKRVARHVEAILDSLRQLGIEIDDPEGRPYDTGMNLKVVSFEPVAGLSREQITETLRPSVTWKGHVFQTGEVVVGTPANS